MLDKGQMITISEVREGNKPIPIIPLTQSFSFSR